jgi:hypothetical protein
MITKIEANFVEDYFKSERVNNSLLSDLHFNPRKAQKKINNNDVDDDDKRHLIIGSALDCMLTQAEEEFNNKFFVVKAKRPSGLTGVFINALPLGLTPDSPIVEYQDAYETAGYRWPIKSAVEALWKSPGYKAWYIGRKQAGDRTLMAEDEFKAVEYAAKSLFSNPFTREFFLNTKEDVDIYYQVPIYFTIGNEDEEDGGVECKALLDILIVDKKNKKIVPVDLKTIGKSLTQFESTFIFFGYYRQAAFYRLAVEHLLDYAQWKFDPTFGNIPMKNYIISPTHPINHDFSKYVGWKIDWPEFVVSETESKYQHGARIFSTGEIDYNTGLFGGRTHSGIEVIGVLDLIKDLQWHKKTDYWAMPKKVYQAQGRQKINAFVEDEEKWTIRAPSSELNLL